MNKYAIEIENLTKEFGSRTAVDNISLKIPPGKIFGFLGPNGSGKSTTIRMLCGVLIPTSGTGKIFGYDIIKDTENVRLNIGYMCQKFSFYEDLTVRENLRFYAKIYGLKGAAINKRIEETLEIAELKGREDQLAGTLSGGWKQRVALSCAIIHNPRLLILDEPTAGVDPVSRRVFWQIIRDIANTGVTILVTTHYMDEAKSCDIISFIFNGKLLITDTPTNILRRQGARDLEEVFIQLESEQRETPLEFPWIFKSA